MQPTGGDVDAFVANVAPAVRRADAATLIGMMREITGREPVLWGTIIGFGSCHYRSAAGTAGDMPLIAFAPRRASTTVYLDRAEDHGDDLARLGPHDTGVSCLYVKSLAQVDLDVLRAVIAESYRRVVDGESSYDSLTVTG